MSKAALRITDLRDLAIIRTRLADERRAAEAAARHAREHALRLARERDLFALTIGEVVPLGKGAAPAPLRPRAPALPRQRERDEAAVLAESIGDDFDAESLLDSDDALSFHRRGIGADVVRKLRRGVWVLQAELDLHGLRRDEARERLGDFLRAAAHSGKRCVRIVHGKGHGSPGREPVLKDKVRRWLVQKSDVLAFAQARASEGGSGALVVLLRSPRDRASPKKQGAVP